MTTAGQRNDSSPTSGDGGPPDLTDQQRRVYAVLAAHRGRVVGREELVKRAGLADLNPRRCDSVIAELRRRLGDERVVTIRKRGWMLQR